MKISTALILILVYMTACDKPISESATHAAASSTPTATATTSKKIIVDKAYIGMPIEEFKRVYKGAEFIEEPVHEYGVDGESMGLKVAENGEPVMFVWTFEGDDKISGITVLSSRVTVDSTIHVGATAGDFFKRNPNAEFEIHMIDERFELGYVKGKNYTVEFLTTDSTRVGNYEYGDSQPKFHGLKRPDAKIDRITIDNK